MGDPHLHSRGHPRSRRVAANSLCLSCHVHQTSLCSIHHGVIIDHIVIPRPPTLQATGNTLSCTKCTCQSETPPIVLFFTRSRTTSPHSSPQFLYNTDTILLITLDINNIPYTVTQYYYREEQKRTKLIKSILDNKYSRFRHSSPDNNRIHISASMSTTDQDTSVPTVIKPKVNILTLGDGNMSFSYDLYRKLRLTQRNPYLSTYSFDLTASSFDSHQELLTKYPEVGQFLQVYKNLEEKPSTSGQNLDTPTTNAPTTPSLYASPRYFGDVNACDIQYTIQKQYDRVCVDDEDQQQQQQPPQYYDLIYFNNPHVGIEDLFRHISLLSHFFLSTHDVLKLDSALLPTPTTTTTPLPQVVITLCDDQPKRWELFQNAFRNGFICIAAVDMVSAQDVVNDNSTTTTSRRQQQQQHATTSHIIEWPYFQNKRHQNNTAFPYYKMVQYYFVPILNLLNNATEFDAFSSLYHFFQQTYANTCGHQCIYMRTDMEVWLALAKVVVEMGETRSIAVVDQQELQNADTNDNKNATAPTNHPIYHIDWTTTPDHTMKTSHNVANWESSEATFTSLFPLIQPFLLYYDYSVLPPVRSADVDFSACYIPGTDYIHAVDVTFQPILSLKKVMECYQMQYQEFFQKLSSDNVEQQQQKQQQTAVNMSTELYQYYSMHYIPFTYQTLYKNRHKYKLPNPTTNNTTSTSTPDKPPASTPENPADFKQLNPEEKTATQGAPSAETSQKTKQDEVFAKFLPFFDHNIDNLISQLPHNLNATRLGRPLTDREVVKLDRFLQRLHPTTALVGNTDQSEQKHNAKNNKNNAHSEQHNTTPAQPKIKREKQKKAPQQQQQQRNEDNMKTDNAPLETPTQPTIFTCAQCTPAKDFSTESAYQQHFNLKHNTQQQQQQQQQQQPQQPEEKQATSSTTPLEANTQSVINIDLISNINYSAQHDVLKASQLIKKLDCTKTATTPTNNYNNNNKIITSHYQDITNYTYCQVCDLYYPNAKHLEAGVEKKENNTNTNTFAAHLEFLSPQKNSLEVLYTCQHCPQEFRHLRALTQHVLVKHPELQHTLAASAQEM